LRGGFVAAKKIDRQKNDIRFRLRSRRKILKLRMISSPPTIAGRIARNGLSTLKIRVKRRLSI
jgi:hypothetical protein